VAAAGFFENALVAASDSIFVVGFLSQKLYPSSCGLTQLRVWFMSLFWFRAQINEGKFWFSAAGRKQS